MWDITNTLISAAPLSEPPNKHRPDSIIYQTRPAVAKNHDRQPPKSCRQQSVRAVRSGDQHTQYRKEGHLARRTQDAGTSERRPSCARRAWVERGFWSRMQRSELHIRLCSTHMSACVFGGRAKDGLKPDLPGAARYSHSFPNTGPTSSDRTSKRHEWVRV